MRPFFSFLCLCLTAAPAFAAPAPPAVDTFPAGEGSLEIRFLGHGTLMLSHAGRTIHVDPVRQYADYATLPKADLVLVTHGHGDHLDPAGLATVRRAETVVVLPPACAGQVAGGTPLANGQSGTFAGIAVRAVPAYNRVHEREPGKPFHPRGEGNGYVVTLGPLRVYVAGDTEDVPEMKDLRDIDIAFLPMNLPYTMTPAMAAAAARLFRPKILYPYHYGETDPQELVKELAGETGIEVRVRDLR